MNTISIPHNTLSQPTMPLYNLVPNSSDNLIHFPNTAPQSVPEAPTGFNFSHAAIPDSDVDYSSYSDFDTEESHAASPLWDTEDINTVCSYLLRKAQYRNLMLFVCGINFGLRISDLLKLHFTDVMAYDPDSQSWVYRTSKNLIETKTAHTRKNTVNRIIYINNAVRTAITIYLSHTPGVQPTDYMFSRRRSADPEPTPLTRSQADRIMKKIATECELPGHIATHTLRKTYAVHLAMTAKENKETMLSDHGMALAQHSLGHSSMKTTLRYLDINNARVQADVMKMNLGYDVLIQYMQAHS